MIASRGSLDLGIGSLVNERHALIYSAADLRIGGALDAAGGTVGQRGWGRRCANTGATIEAGGDARIAVTQLMNLNANYDAYPASRYGPPFDYAPWYTSRTARAAKFRLRRSACRN